MRVSNKSEHRETGQRSSSNDRRPFKSHRLKSFSNQRLPVNTATVFLQLSNHPLPRQRFRGPISPSSQPTFAPCCDVGTHNASGNSAEFIRSFHAALPLFTTACQLDHSPLNNLFDSLQNRRLIKRRPTSIRLSDIAGCIQPRCAQEKSVVSFQKLDHVCIQVCLRRRVFFVKKLEIVKLLK